MKLAQLIPLALAITLIGLPSGVARAQGLTPDRVQLELQRTDERIQQAEELLAARPNPQAAAEIDIAKHRQDEARTELAGGRLRTAVDLTLDARAHANRAISILKLDGVDPARIQEQIDRTREFMDRARDRLNDCPIDRARAELHVAEAMLARAQDALNSGRPLAALQLTRGARQHSRQALQLCHLPDQVQDAVERALQRTDERIESARDLLGARPPDGARQALERAEQLQDAAWRQFRIEHYEPAMRLTEAARTFAQRATRLAAGP